MSIRRLFGTQTLGGHVFWTLIAEHHGWRVQYNRTLDVASPLKPYRLISPDDLLWASSDTAEEMCAALPELIVQFSDRSPLLNLEDLKSIAGSLAATLMAVITARSKGGDAQ